MIIKLSVDEVKTIVKDHIEGTLLNCSPNEIATVEFTSLYSNEVTITTKVRERPQWMTDRLDAAIGQTTGLISHDIDRLNEAGQEMLAKSLLAEDLNDPGQI